MPRKNARRVARIDRLIAADMEPQPLLISKNTRDGAGGVMKE